MRWILFAPTIRTIKSRQYIDLNHTCKAIYIIRTKSTSTVDLVHDIYGPTPTPENEAIFLLHGILGSKSNWQCIGKKIAAHTNTPVIAVDARNHGDSPHSNAHSYFDLAADLSQLITKLSIKKSIIIGHSMGGRTGMVLALTEPSRVASLIVVDVSPIIREKNKSLEFIPKIFDAMMGVDFTGLDTLNKAKTAAKDHIMKLQLLHDEESFSFLLMNIGKLTDNSFGWKCNIKALQKNFADMATFPNMNGKTYKGHTLFIGGKLSKFIPPSDITNIRKLFPKANLLYIDGAGHNVHMEDPEGFFNKVVPFLPINTKNQDQIYT